MTIGQTIDEAITKWEKPTWWNLLVVLPWTIGVILFVYQWNVDRHIATRERTTQGLITAHEPANHNRFRYVFVVNGKNFTGWESSGKHELEIGRSVLVYFDPVDPNKNALTKFGDRGLNILGPVPTMLFGIGAVIWFITSRRRKIRVSSNHAYPRQTC